jgi:asparagine synthase (glutamine-hydrolysing)
MSGIAGIFNLDGAPVDQALLQRMADFMSTRGPDRQEVWTDGSIGLCHTLLRTTYEAEHEHQPCTLDNEVWLVADARVDTRPELIAELRSHGRTVSDDVPDPELILHAYAVWGEECVRHIIGDFGFALWNKCSRRLFCGRDHFGVKPFYYARLGNVFVFSNTFDCVRLHPAVSCELNDLAIADFLMFGRNQEPDTTSFRDISKIPAAHTLTITADKTECSRYWQLPLDGYIRYKKSRDYVEHFLEHFTHAVSDRLRTDKIGVWMSGGMDSSSVAAVAKQVLEKQGWSYDLRAHTTVFDRIIPDHERYYSGLVAQHLNIPIHYLVGDDYKPFDRLDQPEMRTSEPNQQVFLAHYHDQYQQLHTHSRVVLNGFGGDPLLCPTASFGKTMLSTWQWHRLVWEWGKYIATQHRLPPLGTGIRGWWRDWRKQYHYAAAYPMWLSPELEQRLHLRERWQAKRQKLPLRHPHRPEAYNQMVSRYWQSLFEEIMPFATPWPSEERHPFFDVRVVEYLLSLPCLPWFVNKYILRQAMHGLLPTEVCMRPKSPLAGNIVWLGLLQEDCQRFNQQTLAPRLADYIVLPQYPRVLGMREKLMPYQYDCDILPRPLCLNCWLGMI